MTNATETSRGNEGIQAKALAAIRAIRGAETASGGSAAEQLADYRQRAQRLREIRDLFAGTQAEIGAIRDRLDLLNTQRKDLQAQKAKLGLFAGKEKKRLGEEITALQEAAAADEKALAELNEKLGGYQELAVLDRDLYNAQASAQLLDWFDRGGRVAGEAAYTPEQALQVLAAEPAAAREAFRVDPLLRESGLLAREALRMGAHIAKELDTLVFGTYRVKEKKNDATPFGRLKAQEPEERVPIGWRVLKREENRALLISECAIDSHQFARSPDDTWDKSEIRRWLNGNSFGGAPFISEAFTAEERERILLTKVPADRNPKYGGYPGEETEDKIFLLSIVEAQTLFKGNADRICKAAALAAAKGVGVKKETGTCMWWLRTNGYTGGTAFVDYDGSIQELGFDKTFLYGTAVRPALWISL